MAAPGIAITSSNRTAQAVPVENVFLICGIVASLLYVAMMQLIRYDGYNWISQTVSELSAIGAPTRPLWFWLAWMYTALMLAFGWGLWKSGDRNRPLRVVGALILASSLLGFVWPFAPMHQREVLAAGGGTLTDTLHIVLAFVTVPLFLLTMGFGAAAFGKRFRLYSIATLVTGLVAGAFTALDGPRISAHLPTPWLGLWERVNIGVYMIWLVVLAITLLRRHETGSGAV